MIMDGLLLFTGASNGQAIAGVTQAGFNDLPTTGTQTSSNIIDLHLAGIPVLANLQGARDIGIGDDPAMKLLVMVTTAITGGTTLQVNLQGATDNGSGAPAAFSVWWASPVYAEAALVTGARLMDMDMPRPPAGIAIPRFLQIGYVSTGTHSAGRLIGTLVLDRHDQLYNSTVNSTLGGYPAGINVAN
jgi:hypothetical protein